MTETAAMGAPRTGQIYFYFASLTLLTALASPSDYLVDITTSYMLKNQLHASAVQVSTFRLLTAVPIYLAFIFGLMRDLWNPLGRRDRAFLMIFAPITAAVLFVLAFSELSYVRLVPGMLLMMLCSRIL